MIRSSINPDSTGAAVCQIVISTNAHCHTLPESASSAFAARLLRIHDEASSAHAPAGRDHESADTAEQLSVWGAGAAGQRNRPQRAGKNEGRGNDAGNSLLTDTLAGAWPIRTIENIENETGISQTGLRLDSVLQHVY